MLLSALPIAEWAFTGWTGDCSGTEPDCLIVMNGLKEVTATFGEPPVFDLTVTRTGKGKVTSAPAGIVCGADCIEGYEDGTEVTLSKKPKKGWKFVRWTGDCTGKRGCVLTMDSDMAVTAKFKKKT